LRYWNKYLAALLESPNGESIFEQTNLNVFIEAWLQKENSIIGVYRSKRFVQYTTILERMRRLMLQCKPQMNQL
jgi:hypothetical protein